MNSAIKQVTARLAIGLLAGSLVPVAVLASSTVQAQQIQPEPGVMVKRLSMGVGHSVMVDLPRDAAEIFIGSPKVANAVVRSPRKLFILALENGQTTIYALDAQGRQIAVIEISTGRNVEELAQILKTALPKSSITARTVQDTIILTGTVAR